MRLPCRCDVEPGFKEEMKRDVLEGCEPFGAVDKVTVFDSNPDGVVVVKFKQANAADSVGMRAGSEE